MPINRFKGDFNWDKVPILDYKEDGSHFRSITRRVLFEGHADLPTQMRYFEIAADGHSTLERHNHHHVVMIIRGSGQMLLGSHIENIKLFDVAHIPADTWHQFRATKGEALGFVCLVTTERDKPHRPTQKELAELKSNPNVGAFIRT